jgi:D-alanine-D-alanine ligase
MNVYEALDATKYDVKLIKVDRSGFWRLVDNVDNLHDRTEVVPPRLAPSETRSGKQPDRDRSISWIAPANQRAISEVDVVFPLIHGAFGEDGCLQGLLRLLDIPFVGADVLGSAVGMDKDVMKRLLEHAGLPVVPYLVARQTSVPRTGYAAIKQQLGTPFFVKPANAGSSIGIAKVASEATFETALADAFKYDTKCILERSISGRELECSVLGNDNPIASVVGEVVIHSEFYSYDAKYLDDKSATLRIPAELPAVLSNKLRAFAIRAYQTLECCGFARVDFFLSDAGEVYLNEINTLPGFTNTSMYPKLWEATGIPYSDLIDKLIDLAIERHRQRETLCYSRPGEVIVSSLANDMPRGASIDTR